MEQLRCNAEVIAVVKRIYRCWLHHVLQIDKSNPLIIDTAAIHCNRPIVHTAIPNFD